MKTKLELVVEVLVKKELFKKEEKYYEKIIY